MHFLTHRQATSQQKTIREGSGSKDCHIEGFTEGDRGGKEKASARSSQSVHRERQSALCATISKVGVLMLSQAHMRIETGLAGGDIRHALLTKHPFLTSNGIP